MRFRTVLMAAFTVCLASCSSATSDGLNTLAIRGHEGSFELIAPGGDVIATCKTPEELNACLETPEVAHWIVAGQVIVLVESGITDRAGNYLPGVGNPSPNDRVLMNMALGLPGVGRLRFEAEAKYDLGENATEGPRSSRESH